MSKVLVIDDNTELADNLAEILEAEGHEVQAAYGAQEAIERAASFPFDAALVDIRMPSMDGVTLVHHLMRERPTSSYLFMTGYSKDRTLSEAEAISQRAVLSKPVDIARVLRLVGAAASS